jgi:DNA polymerase-3 subunit alpha
MSDQHFSHLHLHTEFSLLDGALRIKDAIAFAKKQNAKAMAITDHGNCFGAVKFFQEAEKAGIKPILGVEMYFTDDAKTRDSRNKYYHMVLLVKDEQGYENLCELMTYSYLEGFYFKPRIDQAILKKHSAGLIASGGCLGGQIPTLLREGQIEQAREKIEWFLDVFGPDNFFFEVMAPFDEKQRITNELLFKYGKEYGIDCVATGDAHYLSCEDKQAHEIMLSIQTKDVISNPDRYSFGDFQGHLKTNEEMLAAFPDNPEVVWNSGKFADRCNFKFTFGKLQFPVYKIDTGETDNEHFARLCREGLDEIIAKKLIPMDQLDAYKARLELEIDLICKMGFVGYFLVVSDFIRWGKANKIPIGPGRGSAAGSLVSWALKITNVDPLKYNLLFERFLNPERISMPDIDIDFCINRREEVIEYVRQKYGHDCVCQIITFGTMMAKGVLKDVARVLEIPFADANHLTDLIPNQLKITLKEALEQEPKLKDLVENNPQLQKLFDISFRLEGLTRHASKHAAGVVITPKALKTIIPMYVPAKTTDLVTQYAMTELETLGFLKMDFLGLKNLSVVDFAIQRIRKNHGIEIDLDSLALDDPAVFKLLGEGKCSGVFQFEGDGVTDVIRRLKPEKFEDLIAVNALYRPGPLGSGMVDDFINRRHGKVETTYAFAELEPILSETYGVIVYQEQVQKIASAIGGYSLGGADLLRRAMGKKKPEEMAKQKSIFLAGAEKGGFDLKKAAELFELMAYFAGYGFNKSHSTAYALIAYHTAYLKTHYPIEFVAALLSFEVGNPDQFSLYLQRTKEFGVTVLPPNINTSDIEFTPTKDGVLFGLKGVKNVGEASLHNILEERKKGPFASLMDFCCRVDLRTSNKRVIESLITAGAFDSLPGNRAQKTHDLDVILRKAHDHHESTKTGQMSLFGSFTTDESGNQQAPEHIFSNIPDWPARERLDKEKQSIGVYLSDHPLNEYKNLANALHVRFIGDPAFENRTDQVTVLALVLSSKVIMTKKMERMAFCEIEDASGKAELIIFPKTFAVCESFFNEGKTSFIIKGEIDGTNPELRKLKAETLVPAQNYLEFPDTVSKIIITLPEPVSEFHCLAINDELTPGSAEIVLQYPEDGKFFAVKLAQKMKLNNDALNKLIGLGISFQLETHTPQKTDFKKTFWKQKNNFQPR